jgi:hypothetical protein
LNDLLKLIEQAFKLHHLRFYLRKLGPRGLADQYLLSKQPYWIVPCGNELDPETADLVSAAFAKSWRFVSTDPELAYDDTEAMRIRLSKHLESLAKYGERDLLRLANGAIVKLRRERQADRRVY